MKKVIILSFLITLLGVSKSFATADSVPACQTTYYDGGYCFVVQPGATITVELQSPASTSSQVGASTPTSSTNIPANICGGGGNDVQLPQNTLKTGQDLVYQNNNSNAVYIEPYNCWIGNVFNPNCNINHVKFVITQCTSPSKS